MHIQKSLESIVGGRSRRYTKSNVNAMKSEAVRSELFRCERCASERTAYETTKMTPVMYFMPRHISHDSRK